MQAIVEEFRDVMYDRNRRFQEMAALKIKINETDQADVKPE